MKTNLVQLRNGVPTTSSLQIAQIFGKEHSKVLLAIRNLECSPNFIAANFGLYHYSSKLNENVTRKLPMYYITKDGFTFLVMGFTGKVAAKFKEDYINAFNSMEKKLKTEAVPKQLLQETQRALVEAQKQVGIWKEQVGYWKYLANSYMDSMNSMTKSQGSLIQIMRDNIR